MAKSHKIDISEIVLKSFTNTYRRIGKYPIDDESKTVVNLKIRMYGLTIPHGFSHKLVPLLDLEADVTNEWGVVVRRADYEVGFFGASVHRAARPRDIMENPDTLRKLWTLAAEKAAKETIEKMH